MNLHENYLLCLVVDRVGIPDTDEYIINPIYCFFFLNNKLPLNFKKKSKMANTLIDLWCLCLPFIGCTGISVGLLVVVSQTYHSPIVAREKKKTKMKSLITRREDQKHEHHIHLKKN